MTRQQDSAVRAALTSMLKPRSAYRYAKRHQAGFTILPSFEKKESGLQWALTILKKEYPGIREAELAHRLSTFVNR